MPHVELHWADLPEGVRAVTDGVARIWMPHMPLQRQRRSTLAHELEHLRAGHRGCQPRKVERHVRAMAAQYLLPDIRHTVDEVIFYGGINDDAAQDLWVDLATLQARFDLTHMPMQERRLARVRFGEELGWTTF